MGSSSIIPVLVMNLHGLFNLIGFVVGILNGASTAIYKIIYDWTKMATVAIICCFLLYVPYILVLSYLMKVQIPLC